MNFWIFSEVLSWVLRGFEIFLNAMRHFQTILCVLRHSEAFLKVPRCSLKFWDILLRSDTFSWVETFSDVLLFLVLSEAFQ